MQALRIGKMAIVSVCLLVGYLLLYIFHVHGYYQVHGAPVLPYETLRFAMNVMSLYSLLAGLGLAVVLRNVPRAFAGRYVFAAMALALYIGFSYSSTRRLREESHTEEYAMRITPARAALEVAQQTGSQNVYIVTLEPLVLQMFGSRQTNVVGLYALSDHLTASLYIHDPKMDLLFVDQSEYANELTERRYESSLRCLDRLRQQPVLVGEEYVLKRVSPEHK